MLCVHIVKKTPGTGQDENTKNGGIGAETVTQNKIGQETLNGAWPLWDFAVGSLADEFRVEMEIRRNRRRRRRLQSPPLQRSTIVSESIPSEVDINSYLLDRSLDRTNCQSHPR
jgi:hypothetical protein